MNIVMTGATGFIGRRVVPRLVADGHSVRSLARRPADAGRLEELAGTTVVEADLTEPESLKRVIARGDCVIHLAVLGHLSERDHDESEFRRVNVEGTRNLLEACLDREAARVVVTSSSAALGHVRSPVIDESSPANPLTPYGRSKRASDLLVEEYARERGLPSVSLLFTHVYGPGDTRDFLKIIRWMKAGVFPQVGLRPNYYPALFIDDAVEAIRLAIDRGRLGERYIITDSDPHDTREVRRLVRQILGLPRRPYPVIPAGLTLFAASMLEKLASRLGTTSPLPSRSIRNFASSRRFSIAKAQAELGFAPTVDLAEGLRRTIAWYTAQGLL